MREHIILKYAESRVPRYTSYPTAPNFSPDVGAADYAAWLACLPPEEAVSLYLHIPFCREMCWYCGCHTKATRRAEPVEVYCDALLSEIDLIAGVTPGRMKVGCIHWGGGSPTYVSPRQFVRLMERLRSRFEVVPGAEIAIEVDPRQFSEELASTFGACGVTRASLGVQTLDVEVQKAVNRIQSFEDVARSVTHLRRNGVARVNLDLLYGLPLQTPASAVATARRVLELSPDRIAAFGYAHVPHLKPHQKMIRDDDLPDASSRLDQASAISDELTAAGYVEIGLDHFAKADDSLAVAQTAGRLRRNFQGYTTDAAPAIIGFGASAIGSFPQGYVQNEPATHNWERVVLAGALPISRGYRLTREDRLRRNIIEKLMCDLKADIAELAEQHGLPLPNADISKFIEAGVVSVRDSAIFVNPDYRVLVRNVAAAFDAFLPNSSARHSVAV